VRIFKAQLDKSFMPNRLHPGLQWKLLPRNSATWVRTRAFDAHSPLTYSTHFLFQALETPTSVLLLLASVPHLLCLHSKLLSIGF
jgi:hypothetical protein